MRVLSALALLLVLAASQAAQAAGSTVMRFDRLAVGDGLTQSSVMAIAQDQAGFMWFATESGIDRFDGHSVVNLRQERGNPNSLASDFARDIKIGQDGRLWIATDGGGVSSLDTTNVAFTTWRHDPDDSNSLSSDRIRTIATDSRGGLWVGTRGAGLNHLDMKSGRISRYEHDAADENSLGHNDIYALAADEDGKVWVGTSLGLDRLDPQSGEVQAYTTTLLGDDASDSLHIRSLLLDRDGRLWVGTQKSGLLVLDISTGEVTRFAHNETEANSIASNRIDALYQDSEGRIWAGTDNGLSLWHEHGLTFLNFAHDPPDPTSLGGNSIFSIYQDRGGVLWIGTRTNGVSRWNPRSWSFGHFRPDASESGEFDSTNITSFAKDTDNRLWLGTFGGGINVLDRYSRTVETFRSSETDSLSDDRVMTLLATSDGHIWAGTMTGGLNEIDPASGQVTVYKSDPANPESIAANGIMSLLEATNGDVWAGTFGGGVSRKRAGTNEFTSYTHEPGNANSLSSPRATSITQGVDGRIWVGTDGGGVNWFDAENEQWSSVQNDPADPTSLSSNTVYSLHTDALGRIWAGTRSGLDLIVREFGSGNRFRVIAMGDAEKATRTAIYGIQSDTTGTLWLSTSRGLISYNPESTATREYHSIHGLQGEEFTFGSSYRSDTGALYFGGPNGFNAFRPDQLERNSTPPQIALTSVSVMNEELVTNLATQQLESLDLDYRDYVVSFGVAALDFAAPKNNLISYRLDGFDADWIDLGSERRITYTNLHGGDYTLQIRAANSDGVWNETGIAIPMAVANPPWKTWWAYLTYAVIAALFALSLWRRQQRRLQREWEYSRRLEREVRDRTRELARRNEDLNVVNAKLHEASTTDPLTGLHNRRYLFEEIGKDVDLVLRHYRDGTETLAPGGNNDLSFLVVDLDNFKPVNDSCGHEAGDELLLQVCEVLIDACRSSDDVIRWGGDEFLVVARDTNRKYVAALAERIRSGLCQRMFPVGNGQVARITTSIGFASFPFFKDRPELLSWEEVLGVADAAMYEAKQRRNAWTGIECLGWEGTGGDLVREIKADPGQLAKDGFIRALESLDDVAENSA